MLAMSPPCWKWWNPYTDESLTAAWTVGIKYGLDSCVKGYIEAGLTEAYVLKVTTPLGMAGIADSVLSVQ